MKNTFKLPVVALAMALAVAGCKGKNSGDKADSNSTVGAGTVTDTVKHSDTTVKVDTVKPATDTSDAKTDTVSKRIQSKTEIKKTEVKKH